MCGLVGAFRANKSKFDRNIDHFLTQGLYVSALRGFGGVGVGLVDQDFKPDFIKSAMDAGNYIFTERFKWVNKNILDARAVLGHTRAPTGSAKISVNNSHPFWFGDQKKQSTVLGMHNGHINNYYSLTPTGFNHEVDSAHAIYSIYLNGAKETLEKITGYYVLVWYDEKEKTMNIARNSHRELYIVQNKEETQMYYASEEAILRFALERNNIPYDEKTGFMELDPFSIYSWNLEADTLSEGLVIKKYDEKKASISTHTGTKHIPSNPGKGRLMAEQSVFYTFVRNPETAFYPYKGSDGEESGWGKVFGTRALDNGLVVIEGVNKKEWVEKWSKLNLHVPCVCTQSKWEEHGEGATKSSYPSYTARISVKDADRDLEKLLSDQDKVKTIEKKESSPSETGEPYGSSKTALVVKSEDRGVIETVKGPNGTYIPKSQWRAIAKEGCVICHGVIMESDIGEVLFYGWNRNPEDAPEDTEYQMVCPVCQNHPDIIVKSLGFMPT